MKRLIRRACERQLPAGYDIDTHFTPRYDPWDQRMCLVPDGDLFDGDQRRPARRRHRPHRDVHRDRASSSRSGHELEADIIVTATGLDMLPLGGIAARPSTAAASSLPETRRLQGHDAQRRAEPGVRVRLHERVVDAQVRPRRASTSAGCSTTWTPRLRAAARRAAATRRCADAPFLDLTSGYVLRSIDRVPQAGAARPVAAAPELRRATCVMLRRAPVDDEALEFSRAA